MSAHFGLSESRIALLGLGLMGGSLALALRGKCKTITGYDPDPETMALANQGEYVDRASSDLSEILPDADLIILAAPVLAIIELIQQLPEVHPDPAVVLDLGSTKEQICRQMGNLPSRFDPIGGHPMCGKETSGLEYAEASIFVGAPFALVPIEQTSSAARDLAEELVHSIGSHPVWLESAIHDRWVAATSHLPYLLSACLALATPLEAAPMAGPGLRGATRLAASPINMMLDIVSTNRENVLLAVERFRERLDTIDAALREPSTEGLAEILRNGRIARQELVPEQANGGAG